MEAGRGAGLDVRPQTPQKTLRTAPTRSHHLGSALTFQRKGPDVRCRCPHQQLAWQWQFSNRQNEQDAFHTLALVSLSRSDATLVSTKANCVPCYTNFERYVSLRAARVLVQQTRPRCRPHLIACCRLKIALRSGQSGCFSRAGPFRRRDCDRAGWTVRPGRPGHGRAARPQAPHAGPAAHLR